VASEDCRAAAAAVSSILVDVTSAVLDAAIATAIKTKDCGRALTEEFVPSLNRACVDVDEERLNRDHGRLTLRLDFYGLREKCVTGDGNCQFRALSDQLFRDNGENHAAVRAAAIAKILASPEDYSPYVAPLTLATYCDKMRTLGEWGDNITLQAVADEYLVVINIVSSYSEHGFIEILPSGSRERGFAEKSPRSLWLSFFAEVHYNSLYPGNTTDAEM
jgi:hypothetical protein